MLGGHAIEDWMTDGWQELRMKLGGSLDGWIRNFWGL